MSTQIRNDNISLLKAGALGAASGYAVKYLFPLVDSETPSNLQKKDFLKKAYIARTNAAKEFANTKLKNANAVYSDEFVKAFELNKAKWGYRQKLETYVPKEIQKLFKDAYLIVRNAGKKAYQKAERQFAFHAKQQRPAGYFIGIGAALFIAGAFVTNVIKDMTD